MAETRFAVIVTCYNYRDYVVEAVDSALAQTRAAVQVIVVDDGSHDGSRELLEGRYGADSRVTLVCTANGGQLAAFQHGIARARADAIAFLDADDRWDADYLERIGRVFDQRAEIDFVFTDIRLFGAESRAMGFADRAIDCGYTAISTYLLAHKYGAPTSALAMRTEWARCSTDLPPELLPTWRICADNCLVYGTSVLGAHKYYLPTGAVHYRTHGNNGWWGKYSARTEFRNRFRSRGLIEHYARRIGLTERVIDDVRYEFRTKPAPGWRETRRYARLAMQQRAPWLARAEQAFGMFKRAWHRRAEAAAENRVAP